MRTYTSKEYLRGYRRNGRYQPWPLHNFLTNRLGLPWDEVYSEICKTFDKRTLSGDSFFGNLRWRVEQNCWIGSETGKVYDSRGLQISDTFYVHPLTGILSFAEKIEREVSTPPIVFIEIDKFHAYQKIEGIWYWVEFRDNPHYFYGYHRRPITHLSPTKKLLRRVENNEVTTGTKFQLGKKELKQLNLKNGR